MQRETRIFSDLDLNFSKHPVKKDVTLKLNEHAISSSVRNIILTNFGERRFIPKFGSGVYSLLFEPLDDMTASNIKDEILNALQNFERRIQIDLINVEPNFQNNGFDVTIRFFLLNIATPFSIGLFLQRLR